MDKEIYNQKAEEMVNSIEDIMGRYPKHRRAHARGQVYEAIFKPNDRSKVYSNAPLFQNQETQAVVRFSHSSPDPTMPDSLSPIKGMAVKFLLPDGSEVNMAAATVSIFVAREPEAFLEMVKIGRNLEKGRPALRDMIRLVRKYPESKSALKLYRKIKAPKSFGTGTYYSIHAFYLTNEDGERTPVKFIWEPPTKNSPTEKNSKRLEEELDERLEEHTVNFNLFIQVGEKNDPVDDPTVEWPKDRAKLMIGHLTIYRKLLKDEETLLFDPTVTGEGIECTEDKILQFRHHVYAVSHERRKKHR